MVVQIVDKDIKCPCCGGVIYVDVHEYETETGTPTPEGFDIWCGWPYSNLDCRWSYDDLLDMAGLCHGWLIEHEIDCNTE